jgi:hypothetical protein
MILRVQLPFFMYKWFMIRHVVGFKPSIRGIIEGILHLGRGRGSEPLT